MHAIDPNHQILLVFINPLKILLSIEILALFNASLFNIYHVQSPFSKDAAAPGHHCRICQNANMKWRNVLHPIMMMSVIAPR